MRRFGLLVGMMVFVIGFVLLNVADSVSSLDARLDQVYEQKEGVTR